MLYHGVGLCDEYPAIPFTWEWNENSCDGVIKPGMVLTVESYVGRRNGGPGVKLEEQVLITDKGLRGTIQVSLLSLTCCFNVN